VRVGLHHLRLLRAWAAAAALALALALLAAPAGAPGRPARATVLTIPARATVLTIGGPAAAPPIAPGFLGFSFEYFAIPSYAGDDPQAIDPLFVRLIRNLTGGEPPVLRIGGGTTDSTWWPAPGVRRPAGATYELTRGWITIARALAEKLKARLILGVNLEADSAAVAVTEAKALLSGIGRSRVEALELGNEPELYRVFSWGFMGAPGRPKSWDFPAFDGDFSRIARTLPNVPLAGPTAGAPRGSATSAASSPINRGWPSRRCTAIRCSAASSLRGRPTIRPSAISWPRAPRDRWPTASPQPCGPRTHIASRCGSTR
jgi:hypothetical protein